MLKGRALQMVERNKEIYHSYFKTITPNSSYFAGVLHADGCLVDRKPLSSRIMLQMNDFDIVKKWSEEVQYPYCYKERKRQGHNDFAVVEFTSNEMFDDLVSLGIDTQKSYEQKPPINLIFKDYIRGLFDGDGSISSSTCRWTLIVTGEGMRDWLIDKFEELEIPYSLLKKVFVGFNQYTFYGKGGKQGYFKFLDYIYDSEGFRGQRKHNIYLRFKRK